MNKLYDRRVAHRLTLPKSSDVNQAVSQAALLATERVRMRNRVRSGNATVSAASSALGADASYGFEGDSFFAYPGADAMTIKLQPGIAYRRDPAGVATVLGSVPGVDDTSMLRPIVLHEAATITLDAAHATLARIDLIEVAPYRRLTGGTSEPVLNELTGVWGGGDVDSELSYAVDTFLSNVAEPGPSTAPIGYRPGTPNVSPTAPLVSPGYTAVAYVYVAAAATSITAAKIVDARQLLLGHGVPIVAEFTYVGGATGGITANLTKVHAPPGIQVGVYGLLTNSSVYVGVIAGDCSNADLLITGLVPLSAFDATPTVNLPVVVVPPAYSVVDSTGATVFGGASPGAVPVTAGIQSAWLFMLRTVDIAGNDYDVLAGARVRVSMLLVPKGGA